MLPDANITGCVSAMLLTANIAEQGAREAHCMVGLSDRIDQA
jgi:hypothetical protein